MELINHNIERFCSLQKIGMLNISFFVFYKSLCCVYQLIFAFIKRLKHKQQLKQKTSRMTELMEDCEIIENSIDLRFTRCVCLRIISLNIIFNVPVFGVEATK